MKTQNKILELMLVSCLLCFAVSCSTTQVQKSPKELSDLHVQMGTASFARQTYPDAVESFRKAILLNPSNAVAHNHLGLTYIALGQRELGKKSIERSVLEDPIYSDGYVNLGSISFEDKKYELAKKYFNKALENLEYKYRHRAITSLAQVYLAEGNLALAKKYLTDSLVVNPDFCQSHFMMGIACNREENYKCAADHFAKSVIRDCVDNAEGHYQLAHAYVKLKNFAKARNSLLILVESYPQTMQAQKAGEELKYIP